MIHLTHILLLAQTGEAVDPAGGASAIPMEFLWATGAVVLAIFVLVTTLKKVRHSQRKDLRSVDQRVDELRPRLNPVRAQIDELMAELADLARQINGQLDTRLARLDILQRDAEATIQRLEALLNQTGPSPEPNDGGSAFRHGATHKESVNNAKSGGNDSARPVQLTAKPQNYIASDRQTQAVLDMAQQGKSALAIAQELDRPIGEVELILALNKK